MAKIKINTGGKILIALLGIALIVFATWKWIIPHKGEAESVKPEFGENVAGADAGDGKAAAAAAGDLVTEELGRPLRVQIFTWGGFAGGLVANGGLEPNKDSIYWKEYGLAVQFKVIDDWPASRAAFKEGSVDVIGGTVVDLALEYSALEEHNPQAFFFEDWSRGGDAIAVTKEIEKVADLEGKRVAVPKGTPSHYFALYLLSQADMETGDINWVWTSSQVEAAQFFRQGKVDAAVSWSPDVYQAAEAREGGHILASTDDATALIPALLIAKNDFLEKHPDVMGKFVLGWLEGVEKTREDTATATRVMAASYEGVNEEAAAGMLQDTKLADYKANLRFFEINGDQLRGYADIYNEANNLWRSIGMSSGRVPPAKTYTASIVKGIRKEAEKRFGPFEEVEPATREFTFDFDEGEAEEVLDREALLTKTIRVHFDTGESELSENAKIVLDEAAALAQTFGRARMRVEGHTDSRGSSSRNKKLSKRRAQAVVDYFVDEHGFPRDKFVVAGRGSSDPIASNDSKDGRAKNRRTEFEIIR